ncbi:exo-alpha-sialidase [Aliifodinibius sp. S!AR15-10]|nr:exo-alpha-sialidase [Aliifodinibius sp. S!AR15-10]
MVQLGKNAIVFIAIYFFGLNCAIAQQQDTAHFVGDATANLDYHHGQLPPVLGVHNIQVLRANRENPEMAEGTGWTYNHAPNMAYWNGKYYVQYLSDPVSEHEPPGQTLMATSKDGYNWSTPEVIFPPYKVPDGTRKNGGVAKDVRSVMHQRMGFYKADNGTMLTLAYHGLVITDEGDPNDGKGIGRVVREIKKDGSYGSIYFINYNNGWDNDNTYYPYYTESDNQKFVEACNELRNTPLMTQQWVEEADRDDPLIPLQEQFKALSYYHLPDDRVVGFWKHAVTSISEDEGRSWEYHPGRAPGFRTANAKQWAQRTSDGRYTLVYNPAEEYRWPLALSVSNDGLEFRKVLLVNGEIPPRRYIGDYKSYGPQYVRGILPGNGNPPGDNMWLSYSMNKEDIWVGSVPVPITDGASMHVSQGFEAVSDIKDLQKWNIYSPLWAPVKIEEAPTGGKGLTLSDRDRYDYSRVDRLFPQSVKAATEFTVVPGQADHGQLDIELQDAKGTGAIRIMFAEDGNLKLKLGPKNGNILKYEAGKEYRFRIEYDATNWEYAVYLNGEQITFRRFYAAVDNLSRVVFRTGERRYFPTIDTMEDKGKDLEQAGVPVREATFHIPSFKTETFEGF